MFEFLRSGISAASPGAAIIISVALMMILGFAATRLTKLLRLPNVTAYILTGIVIGPFCLDLIPHNIIDGMEAEKPSVLRRSDRELRNEKEELKKYRRQELLALRKVPTSIAIERNTWFHLGINSSEQFLYCLRRMLEPVKEHVDNSFNPLPQLYIDEFKPIRQRINDLMKQTDSMISTRRFDNYRNVLAEADECKDELSVVRKRHIDRIQEEKDNKMLQVSLVYLNILQESQQLLSNMRHQLRAAKKFIEN